MTGAFLLFGKIGSSILRDNLFGISDCVRNDIEDFLLDMIEVLVLELYEAEDRVIVKRFMTVRMSSRSDLEYLDDSRLSRLVMLRALAWEDRVEMDIRISTPVRSSENLFFVIE
jgi:hypothetical protein